MNDRFKFRGVLTVTYGGENADDKTVDLIIEKADAIYSGDIGFDIDQLDRAIEKAGITDDIEIDQIHEFCYDNNGCRNDEYFVMDGDIKQCTGLKDKNGKLIYENDLITAPNNSHKLAVIRMENGVYGCKEYRFNGVWEMNLYDLIKHYGVEIIGNIHEQAEQKDVK